MSPIALYIIIANYFVSYGNQDHKKIIDALILINIYWNRLFITDQFQLFQQFLKLDNTEYKKCSVKFDICYNR